MIPDKYTYLLPGDKVPGLEIPTLEQGILRTADGYILLVNFFTIPCPHCKRMLEYIEEQIRPSFMDSEVRIVSVGREHNPEDVASFRDKGNYSLAFAADPDRDIYSHFAERKIPRNYLFDREGKLVYQTRGFDPDQMNTLRAILEELLL